MNFDDHNDKAIPGSFQGSDGDISRISQLAAHKCIRQVTDELFSRVSNHGDFAYDDASQNDRALEFAFLSGFPPSQGIINWMQLAIHTLSDQPEVFVNCMGFHYINVQLMCKHKKALTQVWARFLGSCYDAFILRQSKLPDLFVPTSMLKGWVFGDKGDPLPTCLMAPLRNSTNEAQECYNKSHTTTRCVIGQAISFLKMCFRSLDRSGGALQFSPARVSRMINIVQQQGLELQEKQGTEHTLWPNPRRKKMMTMPVQHLPLS
ncbi:putative nuclease HARBI1 [Heterodontus francisci]|uniref:putative nuclease HARBI1 n=1 Tax=Heterodontus francisci TaxID=7792 RepID=UPI00355BCF2C